MTSQDARARLLDLLEQLGAIQGVRGAIIATADGALASARSGLPEGIANDVAKTVRRIIVASATVGVPSQELLVDFGAARMIMIPLREDATVVVLLERDTAVVPVRNLLAERIGELRELLAAEDDEAGEASTDDELEEEIDRIMQGELGPVLDGIARQFSIQMQRAGKAREEADEKMREQLREWLSCCNPSPHTLPLLVDGLGLELANSPTARDEFHRVVQRMLRPSS